MAYGHCVGTGARRDAETQRDGPAPAVRAVTAVPGGIANETLRVDLGSAHAGFVVRLPPLEPTFPDYDLAPQAAVQNAVAACGIPAPAVVVEDPALIGAPFLAMPSAAASTRPAARHPQAAHPRLYALRDGEVRCLESAA